MTSSSIKVKDFVRGEVKRMTDSFEKTEIPNENQDNYTKLFTKNKNYPQRGKNIVSCNGASPLPWRRSFATIQWMHPSIVSCNGASPLP